LDVQEIKEILVWMEYLEAKDHQDQEDDEVQLVPPVCSVCQDDLDHLEAEDPRVTEVWPEEPVMMVVTDQTDLPVTPDEQERLVQLVQKDFPDEVAETDLPANEEQLELQELLDREVDKEKLEHLAKKVLSDLLEKLEPKEPRDTEAWMV